MDLVNFTPNENFVYYLHFISERMNIFWKRKEGAYAPYTDNEVLSKHKFTNVYRSLDRVSQYLINEVIYNGNAYSRLSMFKRILIFKHFNQIETWELIKVKFGDVDENINFKELGDFLTEKINEGVVIYSNAYMVTSAFMKENGSVFNEYGFKGETIKHVCYFKIFQEYLYNRGNVHKILESKSMEELYKLLCDIPGFGRFIAMQYCIDFNYSELFDFSENDFIVQGPGAERGIDRCFEFEGKSNYVGVINWVKDNLFDLLEIYKEDYPDLNLNFKQLPNRKPTLIDIQNCFCETDKFLRGMGVKREGVNGKRVKNMFIQNNKSIEYKFPPKWAVEL